jgi:hypothetical protein
MSTDYPKALKKNLTILFCYLKGYKKRLKWFENDIYMRNYLCTPLHHNIMQHLFESWKF